MLSLSLPGRVFLCLPPTDMRKSFDSLAGLVEQQLGQDPLAGDLFVFRSKRGDRLKLLYWDSDGLAIWCKRLEEGTFVFPASDQQRAKVGVHGLIIRPAELAMLLDGIDLANVKRRRRYRRPEPSVRLSARPPAAAGPRSAAGGRTATGLASRPLAAAGRGRNGQHLTHLLCRCRSPRSQAPTSVHNRVSIGAIRCAAGHPTPVSGCTIRVRAE
jgi:transposase